MPDERRPSRSPGDTGDNDHNDHTDHTGNNGYSDHTDHTGNNGYSDRPTPPARKPPAARHKRPDPLPQPPLPPPCDTPPLGTPGMTIRFHGTEDQIIAMAERLTRGLDVRLCLDACIHLPDDAWDQLPPNFLSAIERGLVREDLRHSSTEEIRNTLHISRNSIHTYRTNIRSKFLSIQPELRPVWMVAWLRRYPGAPGSRRDQ
ncbi:MAG: hypothetical protein OHK0022_18920 [Roseiflexaceae bacterium]